MNEYRNRSGRRMAQPHQKTGLWTRYRRWVAGLTRALESRIVPTLAPGSIVTDTRANIHYLVTEYGKVNLKGLSTWQKTEAIISVAHPQFRDQLIAEAEKMHIWRASNKR